MKARRTARGQSLEDISHATGLAVNTIWRIENGLNRPHRTTRRLIAAALDSTEQELFPEAVSA
jgi:transcriptional regulator with XRE-family HTH domain